jgi:hypothetical protein
MSSGSAYLKEMYRVASLRCDGSLKVLTVLTALAKLFSYSMLVLTLTAGYKAFVLLDDVVDVTNGEPYQSSVLLRTA